MAKTKNRRWRVELEDGTVLLVDGNDRTARVTPKFAVRCEWQTSPMRRCGEIAGLGVAWEADPNAKQVTRSGYALFQRKADAKAAAENSLPHKGAVRCGESQHMLDWTELDKRSIVKVAKAEELTVQDLRREQDKMRRASRGSRRVMTDSKVLLRGITSKRDVEEALAKDAELRDRGYDLQQRRSSFGLYTK